MDARPREGGASVLVGGRYEVGEVVGQGGTARVHRARDRVGDTTVAVKIFPPGSAAGAGRDGSGELAVLDGMRHPGLVAVRDSGVDGEGRPYVVMDFVEGQSLAARLRQGPLPAARAARLAAALADALAYVHARGVVHRDVKPGNVLLDEEGNPLLTDFGIARLVDATRVTATGLVVGTAAFMAPEQVRGEVVGPPADVYALGLVLLECVTGRREFEGAALESAIARLHRSPVVPPELPEPLASTIRRMTATDPAQRPTASEAAAALRTPLAGPRRVSPALTRRLVSAGAFASLAASVVAGLVLLTGPDTSAGAPAEPVVAIAAPVPDVALPASEPSTTAPPVTATPTAADSGAPVPVALSRRTVTRTVTRTVADEPESAKKGSGASKDDDRDEKKKKDDDKKKDDKDKKDDKKKDGDGDKEKKDKSDKGEDGKAGNDSSGPGGGGNSGPGKSGDA